jgi:hypothetical protein
LNAAGLLGGWAPNQQQQQPSPADPGREYRRAAVNLWSTSFPIVGSLAERYLRGRDLLPCRSELRYHPRTPCGRGVQAIFRPAMLAAVRDGRGLVAVHRTFLDPKSGRLANFPNAKRALGRLGGGAVRLFAPRGRILGWAEGIENAIAATMLSEIPCWAALGTERFAHVALPPGVEHLILFLDNDAGGRRAERLARHALSDAELMIEARYPVRLGDDWNDVLRGRLSELTI